MTIFRVDFGSKIGLGHLKRSLVYAKRFDEVVYISKSDKNFTPYKFIIIKDEEEFFLKVKELQPKEVIVDNYDFICKNEKEFKSLFPHIKLTVFDDDYREHFCDEIINHNISANKEKYPNPNIVKIIPPLIRDEFIEEKKIKREKIYDIFLSMGGTDSTNINIPILKTLSNSAQIILITTSANENLEELKKFVTNKDNIALHVDSNEVAKLLNQSKFAIITPSVIVHEVLFMEIPFIAIKTAENQDDIYEYLKKHKYDVFENIEKWYNKQKRVNHG
jgi:UDP-2,4-diacetamido-2,4,6-trideoxy-beta-L-altropyranose hydrolase